MPCSSGRGSGSRTSSCRCRRGCARCSRTTQDGSGTPTETLRRLALQTGGGHFVLTERDDVNSTFTRVANELHHQYVLGFSLQKFDGKPHVLDVLVSRPGMMVRARKSYLAPMPDGDVRQYVGAGFSRPCGRWYV